MIVLWEIKCISLTWGDCAVKYDSSQALGHWCEERCLGTGQGWSLGRRWAWASHCTGWGWWRNSCKQSSQYRKWPSKEPLLAIFNSRTMSIGGQAWRIQRSWSRQAETLRASSNSLPKSSGSSSLELRGWTGAPMSSNSWWKLAGKMQVLYIDQRTPPMHLFRANAVTDFLVVHEHRGVPDGLVVCHLPHGPTAYFTMSDIVMR